jgi:hypothetical protein
MKILWVIIDDNKKINEKLETVSAKLELHCKISDDGGLVMRRFISNISISKFTSILTKCKSYDAAAGAIVRFFIR